MNYELYRTAIFDALCACVNLDRHSREAAALIHEAYAEPENVPRPPRNRNVIYLLPIPYPPRISPKLPGPAETQPWFTRR